eukprot:5626699-Pleurochrysis_carterae.AAC.1
MRLPEAPAPGDYPLHPTAAAYRLRPFPRKRLTLDLLTAVHRGCCRRSIFCTIVHSRGQALSH